MQNKFLLKFFLYVFLPLILVLLGINLYLEKREENSKQEITLLLSSLDKENIEDVVKKLSLYDKDLRDSVTVADLNKTGIHPELGKVTLKQHLATWVVHDLTHLFQITETLALRYKEAVGPWVEYLRVLNL